MFVAGRTNHISSPEGANALSVVECAVNYLVE